MRPCVPDRRRRVALVAALGAVVALLAGSISSATADVFSPLGLASEGSLGGGEAIQAEYAHDTAISGDGRFLVFDGSVGGATGVWRLDRASGGLQQVAGGSAQLPSISEDGRYVSFSTNEGQRLPRITAGLEGEAPPEAPGPVEAVNVYVRDMSLGPGEAGAFTVASAASGATEPLRYEGELATRGKLGSTAAGRSAISADGSEVAFVTTAVSNLLQGASGATETPALQVAVRYLRSEETILVSAARAGGPVLGTEGPALYGAVFGGARTEFGAPPAYDGNGNELPGASLSADGSTVAWMGEDIRQQAALLPGESGRTPRYTEPLWRRIEPGSETPTERVTGGSDPGNPACAESGETSLPATPTPSDPCQGPFDTESETSAGSSGIWSVEGGDFGNFIPQLSSDGHEVAFLSEAPLATAGENFGRTKGQPNDAYVVDMHPGLTRDQAIKPLTQLGGGENDRPGSLPVIDVGISSDGEQVAFATRRTQFPLGDPALVSPAIAEPGLNELFDANLADQTLTRVTHGYQSDEEPSGHPHRQVVSGEEAYPEKGDGAASPSFSADDRLLAFSSTASNLVFGDGNTPPAGPLDGSDAFVAERVTFAPLPTTQALSAVPQFAVQPQWRLDVTARSASNGTVALYVLTPGAGALSAHATASIRLKRPGRAARSKASARRRRKAGRTRSRAAQSSYTVATRSVAQGSLQADGGPEAVVLTLRLAPAYASLASAKGGLSATIQLRFSAPGHATITESLQVVFAKALPGGRKAAKRARSSRRRRRRRA